MSRHYTLRNMTKKIKPNTKKVTTKKNGYGTKKK